MILTIFPRFFPTIVVNTKLERLKILKGEVLRKQIVTPYPPFQNTKYSTRRDLP